MVVLVVVVTYVVVVKVVKVAKDVLLVQYRNYYIIIKGIGLPTSIHQYGLFIEIVRTMAYL